MEPACQVFLCKIVAFSPLPQFVSCHTKNNTLPLVDKSTLPMVEYEISLSELLTPTGSVYPNPFKRGIQTVTNLSTNPEPQLVDLLAAIVVLADAVQSHPQCPASIAELATSLTADVRTINLQLINGVPGRLSGVQRMGSIESFNMVEYVTRGMAKPAIYGEGSRWLIVDEASPDGPSVQFIVERAPGALVRDEAVELRDEYELELSESSDEWAELIGEDGDGVL